MTRKRTTNNVTRCTSGLSALQKDILLHVYEAYQGQTETEVVELDELAISITGKDTKLRFHLAYTAETPLGVLAYWRGTTGKGCGALGGDRWRPSVVWTGEHTRASISRALGRLEERGLVRRYQATGRSTRYVAPTVIGMVAASQIERARAQGAPRL